MGFLWNEISYDTGINDDQSHMDSAKNFEADCALSRPGDVVRAEYPSALARVSEIILNVGGEALTYSDPLRMNRAKVGVFKERDQVSLNRFLQSAESGRLEA